MRIDTRRPFVGRDGRMYLGEALRGPADFETEFARLLREVEGEFMLDAKRGSGREYAVKYVLARCREPWRAKALETVLALRRLAVGGGE